MTGLAPLLADGHTAVPSEAVGSGLGVWWLVVAVMGLFTAACAVGFVRYLRQTSPQQWQGDGSTVKEAS